MAGSRPRPPGPPQAVDVRPTGYDGEFAAHAVVAVAVTVAAGDADRLGYLYAGLYLPEYGRHDYCADVTVTGRHPVPVHGRSAVQILN